uniref:Uncharacterized protein n=1 Tax=Tetradesmus obliquus TaxID=3088 RepID=A0A383WG32_TETOB|eukprot:jgi/Sobl393_1/1917/SZX76350.1
MGVPGLFSFLRRRYPQICRPTEKRREGQPRSDSDTTDNLYIDMNHIIHSCTHAYVAKDRPEGLSRQQQLGGMAAYLEALLDLLQPRRVVLIAVDGVAPRAKMNQQRTRRFLSAHISDIADGIEREVRREMLSEAGGAIVIPEVTRFDSNIITPGTDFMTELAQWLRQWAADKAANDPRFKHTTFIISDASEPGEGEHKVMKFVRHLKAQPGYDPATRHVVYGQDADLLLLALLCHEPYFKVMREDMQGGEAASSKAAMEAQMTQEQQQLLQLRPLSAVAAALQQQQQPGTADLPPLPLVPQSCGGDSSRSAVEPCSEHLHMPCFETVDIAVLRECLQWEFSELVGPPGPPGMYGSDEEDEVDDDIEDSEADAESKVDTVGAEEGSEGRDGLVKATAEAGAAAAAVAAASQAAAQESNVAAGVDTAAGADAAAAIHAGAAEVQQSIHHAAADAAQADGVKANSRQPTPLPLQIGAAAAAAAATSRLSPTELDDLPEAVGDEDAGDDESSDELGDLLGLALHTNSSSTCRSRDGHTASPAAEVAPGVALVSAAALAAAAGKAEEQQAVTAAAAPTTQPAAAAAATSAAGLRLPPLLGLPPHLAKRIVAEAGFEASAPAAADVQAAAAATAQPAKARQCSTAADVGTSIHTGAEPIADSTTVNAAVEAAVLTAAGGTAGRVAAAAADKLPSVAGSSSSSSSSSREGPSEAVQDAATANTAADGDEAAAIQQSTDTRDTTNSSSGSSSRGGDKPAAAAKVKQRSNDSITAGSSTQRPPKQRGKAGLSFERLLDDLVVLSFLAGNDFLPNVPSIDIYDKPCGLDLLFTAYKALLLGMGGHLTSGGTINRSRLVQLLVFLARDEEAAYKRWADYRRRRAQQRHNEQAAAQQQLSSLLDGGLSMGELPPGIDLDALLSGLDPSVAEALGLSGMSDKPPPPDLTTLSPGQLCEELAGRVAARVKERLMGGDPWAQDPICMDLPGYRQRYYEARFPELLEEFEGDVDRVAARVAWDYMQGISWLLRYYTCGPAALQWQQHGQPAAAAAAAAGQQQLVTLRETTAEEEEEEGQEDEAEGDESSEEGSAATEEEEEHMQDVLSGSVQQESGGSLKAAAAAEATPAAAELQADAVAGSAAVTDTGADAGAAAAAAESMESSSDGDDDLMALLLGSEVATQPEQQQQQQQQQQQNGGITSHATASNISGSDMISNSAVKTEASARQCSSSSSFQDKQVAAKDSSPGKGKAASPYCQSNAGMAKVKRGSNSSSRKKSKSASSSSSEAAAGIEGASWTWCYPHHYAPLRQDLAKAKLWQKQQRGSRQQDFSAPPVQLSRSLSNPHSCTLQQWAPPGGPVRPLLQLMCVLPAKSVGDALPAVLANLIVLAENMDEDDGSSSSASKARQRQQQRLGQVQGSKAARKAARRQRQAAAAAKVQGLSGLDVLAALGEDGEVALLGSGDEKDAATAAAAADEDGVEDEAAAATAWGEGDGEATAAAAAAGAAGQYDTWGAAVSSAAAANGAAAAAAEYSALLGFELSSDADVDELRLAQQLAATFPSNVEPLVDLTGKRWLHTGVVRLPMAQLQLIAAVLQAALALQQSSRGLSSAELLRNSFRPAAVVATAAAAAAAAAADAGASRASSAETAASNDGVSLSPAVDAAPAAAAAAAAAAGETEAASGCGSSNSSAQPQNVWALLLRTAEEQPQASSSASTAVAAASVDPGVANSAAAAAAAAARLGALGLLLGHRGALSSIPSSTLQCLPQRQQQQQQQQGQPVIDAALDLAGLPVPEHSCCLLPGAEPPHLTVTPAVWRHVAAGFASSISYAEKVLGIRSSSNSEAAAEGDGSRGGFSGRGGGGGFSGRGRSGRAGGAGERGRGGRDVRYGGRRGSSSSSYGAGAGSSRTGDAGGAAGYAAYGASQQQQQQQQPYLDPAYYYADDSYYAAGGSSSGGRGRGSRGGGYGSRTRGSRY